MEIVTHLLYQDKPVNPVKRMDRKADDFPITGDNAAFVMAVLGRARLSGMDRWSAAMTGRVHHVLRHRQGVRNDEFEHSEELNHWAAEAAFELAAASVEALASWTPEFFELIAKWMRHYSLNPLPSWVEVIRHTHDQLKEAGCTITKSLIKEQAIIRMKKVTGTDRPEPTKWSRALKAAGCGDVARKRPGPLPKATNAGRPPQVYRRPE
jgi:hypothetical protein